MPQASGQGQKALSLEQRQSAACQYKENRLGEKFQPINQETVQAARLLQGHVISRDADPKCVDSEDFGQSLLSLRLNNWKSGRE